MRRHRKHVESPPVERSPVKRSLLGKSRWIDPSPSKFWKERESASAAITQRERPVVTAVDQDIERERAGMIAERAASIARD